ncbi:hypothetical protein [Salininema proteolyticum]|uniref:Transposase n=1 Tax=Salininema proteolyticum TaxID=1607685 RepID=A0ABV8U402_9ACTN
MITLYSDDLHRKSRSMANWKADLGDKLIIAIRPYLRQESG